MTSSRPAEPSGAEIDAFVDALPVGRGQALTARQLAPRLGLHGANADRTIRSLAEHATLQGHLLCADNGGYFRPESADEAAETIGRLRSQGSKMLERARTLQALADREFVGQGKLF